MSAHLLGGPSRRYCTPLMPLRALARLHDAPRSSYATLADHIIHPRRSAAGSTGPCHPTHLLSTTGRCHQLSSAPTPRPPPPALLHPVTTLRPKVLIYGHDTGAPAAEGRLRDIATVVSLPREPAHVARDTIRRAVDEHGPFVAVGGTVAPGDPRADFWDEHHFGPVMPGCKLFVSPGAGYDRTDLDWVSRSGAWFANTPKEIGTRTADGAVMLTLAALRGLTPHDLSARAGHWRDDSVRSLSLREITTAIIGLGNIGAQVAGALSALGARHIIYNNRRAAPHAAAAGFEWVPALDDVWQRADCIVLTCPLTPATRGLIGRETLGKIARARREQGKGGIVLVNVSRGPVVDEEALADALDDGTVMRAALDVFEHEPEIHPRLMANKNVTLSPHTAPGADSMGPPMNAEVLDNIVAFLQTGRPLTPVNEAALDAAGWLADTQGSRVLRDLRAAEGLHSL